jgi:hypothetical protein
VNELFGILVIAGSALALFVLSAVQIAHRVVDHRVDPLLRVAVLPELDDVPLGIVASSAGAIAVGSQLPVGYLLALHGAELSPAAAGLLAAEILIVTAWLADLAGARRAVRGFRRTARERIRRYARRGGLAS